MNTSTYSVLKVRVGTVNRSAARSGSVTTPSTPAVASNRAIADHDAQLERLTPDPFRAPRSVLARHSPDEVLDLGAEPWPAASRAGRPAPEQTPALPMPAHHGVGRDDPQVLTPAGTPPPRQDPEQLVPSAKSRTWSSSSRAGQGGDSMAQEQILEREVLAWTHPGQNGRSEKPEQFEHALSIADLRPHED
jgi:hypothetical protein